MKISFQIRSGQPEDNTKIPTVVMIAFDGFKPEYVQGNILEKFKRDGSSLDHLSNVFPTQTFPNFHTISTGLYPDIHGVLSNSVFDNTRTQCLDHSRPEVYSYNADIITPIWILNEKSGDGRRSGVMMWPASNFSFQGMLPTFVKNFDPQVAWEERIDIAVGWLTNSSTPANLVLIYFEEPDATAHKYGPNSTEVHDQLKRINRIVWYYTRRLRDNNLLDDVNTILVSDHGMVAIDLNNRSNLNEYIDPKQYTLCGHSPILQIQPKSGSSGAHLYESLTKGANESGLFDVYRRQDIPNEWHWKKNPRCPDILVVCTIGHVFTDVEGLKGQHGYVMSHEMNGFFMARGPLFKDGYTLDTVPVVRNIDVYPLIASILNLKPTMELNGTLENIQNILKSADDAEEDEFSLF